ncbi:MAG: polyketide cyclase [Bacteroidetes bacterium]|nr:MAG: polyketide cyclase [Bacteroidota bacterium]
MQKEIKTTILINARPSQVWAVLTDFKKYPDWNPFVKMLKGEVKVGSTIEVNLQGMRFKPEVLTYLENEEFRWKGKLWIKGIFDGEHIFSLKENQDGTTTFEHREKFNGILVRALSKKLDTETKSGFKAMNIALKERVEA